MRRDSERFDGDYCGEIFFCWNGWRKTKGEWRESGETDTKTDKGRQSGRERNTHESSATKSLLLVCKCGECGLRKPLRPPSSRHKLFLGTTRCDSEHTYPVARVPCFSFLTVLTGARGRHTGRIFPACRGSPSSLASTASDSHRPRTSLPLWRPTIMQRCTVDGRCAERARRTWGNSGRRPESAL